ncbi:sialate O-acetylesterase [Saccharicrinis fermentans]|uniref:Sialate O-acetylesterase domain-containing protein n=1 Tax=Saccharicrinis fermentans DSM 9555 = JCM 21142 TaxID=869213 RepID=W7YHB5_9BACT|nr:sialate O-acetylesterase [Saccharicrinis fermentans]GAF01979.1 hypothetical protein JCM21142_1603 [Saccharicrinis fermentans DSM 9555 = JCM 21142]
MKLSKIFICIFVCVSCLVNANVRLNALFSNGMVVQQKTKINVWGWADPQEKISLTASWGAKAEVVTASDSTWRLKIKTPKAGGPFKITISGHNTIVIDDVLAGEVWLCSGQSNMDFSLGKFLADAREKQYQPLVEYIREEVARAHDPWLRHIEVPQTASMHERKYNFSGNWRYVNMKQTAAISAIGYFYAKEIRKRLNVPVGIVECAWGGSRIQPWISKEAYGEDEEMNAYFEEETVCLNKLIEEMDSEHYMDTAYQRKLKEYRANKGTVRKPWPQEHPEKSKQTPASLYNGMVSAIVPYTIKGALWYQGESNSHYMEEQYEKYFTALINSWRKEWGQGDFPFYWVQLASYKVPDHRSDMGWAMVNDHLRRTMKLPNTGMAVLHDIGEASDVHPHNKMDAGKRLALWALKKDYHQKVAAVSGPLYKRMKVIDNKVVVEFEHAESGLMVAKKNLLDEPMEIDEPLQWFEIAGENGVWKKAKARIISKNKIEMFNADITDPVKVRYAWSSNPQGANLYNREGLPAAIFSSEK